MDYQTFVPSAALGAFVKCYWILRAPAEEKPQRQRIVPDGCMEMIFHLGDQYRQYGDGDEFVIQPRWFVFGQLTKVLEIAPSGVTNIFAVRFHPDGFKVFSPVDINQLNNQAVALKELYGERGEKLGLTIAALENTGERIVCIEEFLMNQLTLPSVIDALAQSSVALLLKTKGQLAIEHLAEEGKLSKRQLERRFASVIGLSPKQLSKIIRLQATLQVMEQKQFATLTELAHEGGYFDQAHFIKDFKEFTGLSPRHFYSESLKMSSLFIGSE